MFDGDPDADEVQDKQKVCIINSQTVCNNIHESYIDGGAQIMLVERHTVCAWDNSFLKRLSCPSKCGLSCSEVV